MHYAVYVFCSALLELTMQYMQLEICCALFGCMLCALFAEQNMDCCSMIEPSSLFIYVRALTNPHPLTQLKPLPPRSPSSSTPASPHHQHHQHRQHRQHHTHHQRNRCHLLIIIIMIVVRARTSSDGMSETSERGSVAFGVLVVKATL